MKSKKIAWERGGALQGVHWGKRFTAKMCGVAGWEEKIEMQNIYTPCYNYQRILLLNFSL